MMTITAESRWRRRYTSGSTSEAGIGDSCDTTVRTIQAFVSNSLQIGTSHHSFTNTLRSDLSRLRWARQVTDALCFVHAADVIHGDLTLDNVFLTQDLDIKLADFGGSSLDGSKLLVSVRANHRFPGPLLSTDADIFSLGSAHYTIMTGKLPYQDLSEKEITALFKEGRFPETDTLGPFGAIIRKCWQVKYKSVVDVYKDIEGMILRLD